MNIEARLNKLEKVVKPLKDSPEIRELKDKLKDVIEIDDDDGVEDIKNKLKVFIGRQ